MTIPKDFLGREIKVGDTIFHVNRQSSSIFVDTRKVLKVNDNGSLKVSGSLWNKKEFVSTITETYRVLVINELLEIRNAGLQG